MKRILQQLSDSRSLIGVRSAGSALLAALLTAGCASAAIIPISQIRTLSAGGSVNSEGSIVASNGGNASAPGFGVFDKSVGFAVSYTDPEHPLGGGANGIAKQLSAIHASGITAELIADASASAFSYDPDFFDVSAGGSSLVNFQVTFDVTEKRTYRLKSSGLIFDGGEAYMGLSQGATILAENWGYSLPDFILDLEPGRYVLESMISAFASAGLEEFRAGRSEMTFELTDVAPVPEPGTAILMVAGIVVLIAAQRVKAG